MKRILLMLFLSGIFALFAESVQLGRIDEYTIVIPSKPAKQERYAAELLAEYLEKLYKVTVYVKADNSKISGSYISVGETKYAKDNKFTEKLENQSYSFKVKGKNIFIRGGFPGPLNGVITFLQEDLGCRWYAEPYTMKTYKDPGLRFIPDLSGQKLKITPRSYVPPFKMREIRYLYGYRANEETVQFLRQNPISSHSFMPAASGGRLNSNYYVHTYTKLLPPAKYYKEHPEYFALQKGRRVKQRTTFGTVCYTNPDVPKIMADNLRKEIAKFPDSRYFSVSVNDSSADFCECENCAPLIKKIGTSGMQIMLANKIAEILCKDYPEIKITTLIYGSGHLKPGNIKAHPNVTLFVAPIGARYNVVQMLIPIAENPIIVKSLKECFKASNSIFIWDYIDTEDYPFPNFDSVRESLRYLAKQKVEGYNADVTLQGRSLTPLKKWVFNQLLWNPETDMDALITEFINAYYGKAAPEISEYVKIMRRAWRNFKAEYDKAGGNGVMLIYSAQEKSAMRKLLDSALAKAGNDNILYGRVAREYLTFMVMELAQHPQVYGIEKYKKDYEFAVSLLVHAPYHNFIQREKIPVRWKNKIEMYSSKNIANRYSPNTVIIEKPVLGSAGGPYADDSAALDGKASCLRGQTTWGIQWKYWSFIEYFIPGKTYVMRIRTRAESKRKNPAGRMFTLHAFHHGNQKLNKRQPVFEAKFTPEDSSGKYRWIVLGKVDFKNPAVTGMFWMTCCVPADEALWFDRMELIPIDEYKEDKSSIPEKTIIL